MTAAADAEIDLYVAVGHLRAGRLSQAETAGRALLAASAGEARLPALRVLAAVLGLSGRHAEAAEALAEAGSFDADGGGRDPACWNDLAVALEHTGRLAEAEAAYRRAVQLCPTHAHAHNHLGNALRKLGRLDEAVAHHREALRLNPGYAPAYNNLAAALLELGRAEEAIGCHRMVVRLLPGSHPMHSALLHDLHFSDRVTPEQIFEEHVRWAEAYCRLEEKVNPQRPPAGAERPREEPLCHPVLAAFFTPPVVSELRPLNSELVRIGYVSPDFREHPVARFLEPVLANHDRSRFEIYCYSDVGKPDAVTQRLRGLASVWRDVRGMPDERVAEMVRSDGIDVLVDLTGHMAGYRPLLFARKPAGVAVAYIGYPDTTGIRQMDYKVTDSLHDPPGESEHLYTEKLVRLDPCCWCYWPGDDAPAVNELPAQSAGHVTFGVMNRLSKASPTAMRLWAKVLEAVPNSRLMVLVATGAEHEQSICQRFADHGIDPARLDLVPKRPRREYLKLFHAIDIALDTFPYNGHTTTLDALWMGVPTVSLAGATHTQRAGLSVLSAMGLREQLIADSPEGYVKKAVRLASDLPRLAQMRSGLRERMRRSPLCDGRRLTVLLEQAYREMRTRSCQSH